MSRRTWGSVVKVFYEEVDRAFGFLVAEFDFVGPDRRGILGRSVGFSRPGILYDIFLNPQEMSVSTSVEVPVDGGRLVAAVTAVAVAAGVTVPSRVGYSAHNVRTLGMALKSQAACARLVYPVLTEHAVEVMHKANARLWRS